MAKQEPTRKTYCGAVIPMVTPLTNEGELDEPAAKRIVEHLIAGGVQGIFVLGSTGEGASLPKDIRSRLVHIVTDLAGARVKVYAGIFNLVVSGSIEAAREYLRRGVSAVVAQLPNYFTLPPDSQFLYFSDLAKRINGPVLLYDIPAAVHMSIDLGVIEHLRAFSNVVGIKDSSGDSNRLHGLLETYADDARFSVLTGTTSLAAHAFRHGADGFVPSVGNLNPGLCARLYQAAVNGDTALMDTLQNEVDAIQAEFYIEGYIGQGIARLKKRMAQRGLCTPKVLPPLVEAGDD